MSGGNYRRHIHVTDERAPHEIIRPVRILLLSGLCSDRRLPGTGGLLQPAPFCTTNLAGVIPGFLHEYPGKIAHAHNAAPRQVSVYTQLAPGAA